MSFLTSLEVGKQGEFIIQNLFKSQNIISTVVNRPDYDLLIQFKRKKIKAEVKYDVYANKSGRIAIEVYNSRLNKPSGIFATTAHVWFIVLSKKEIYMVPTRKLIHFVAYTASSEPLWLYTDCGDGNADIMLYTKTLFNTISTRVNKNNILSVLGKL